MAKGIYIGAPKCFLLEQAAKHVYNAFANESFAGLYVVGSCLQKADWRDVDVRLILADEAFAKVFPDAAQNWEMDERWLLMTTAISGWMSQQTGLPIDFQIQPMTHANKQHTGPRSAIGLTLAKPNKD